VQHIGYRRTKKNRVETVQPCGVYLFFPGRQEAFLYGADVGVPALQAERHKICCRAGYAGGSPLRVLGRDRKIRDSRWKVFSGEAVYLQ